MGMSGAPMLGCCLRMTREEVRVEATYQDLYKFFPPGDVPLRVQAGSSKTPSKGFDYREYSGTTAFRSAGKVKRTKDRG